MNLQTYVKTFPKTAEDVIGPIKRIKGLYSLCDQLSDV